MLPDFSKKRNSELIGNGFRFFGCSKICYMGFDWWFEILIRCYLSEDKKIWSQRCCLIEDFVQVDDLELKAMIIRKIGNLRAEK